MPRSKVRSLRLAMFMRYLLRVVVACVILFPFYALLFRRRKQPDAIYVPVPESPNTRRLRLFNSLPLFPTTVHGSTEQTAASGESFGSHPVPGSRSTLYEWNYPRKAKSQTQLTLLQLEELIHWRPCNVEVATAALEAAEAPIRRLAPDQHHAGIWVKYVPRECSNPHLAAGTMRTAFAMVISNFKYLDGALVLGHTLLLHSPDLQRNKASLVLVIPHSMLTSSESPGRPSFAGRLFDNLCHRIFAAGFDYIVVVGGLASRAPKSYFADTFDKLYLVGLTLFDKVAYVDTDMLATDARMKPMTFAELAAKRQKIFDASLKGKLHRLWRHRIFQASPIAESVVEEDGLDVVVEPDVLPHEALPDQLLAADIPSPRHIGALGGGGPYFQTGTMVLLPNADVFADLADDVLRGTSNGTYNKWMGRDGMVLRAFFSGRNVPVEMRGSGLIHFGGYYKPWFCPIEPGPRARGSLFGGSWWLWWAWNEHRNSILTAESLVIHPDQMHARHAFNDVFLESHTEDGVWRQHMAREEGQWGGSWGNGLLYPPLGYVPLQDKSSRDTSVLRMPSPSSHHWMMRGSPYEYAVPRVAGWAYGSVIRRVGDVVHTLAAAGTSCAQACASATTFYSVHARSGDESDAERNDDLQQANAALVSYGLKISAALKPAGAKFICSEVSLSTGFTSNCTLLIAMSALVSPARTCGECTGSAEETAPSVWSYGHGRPVVTGSLSAAASRPPSTVAPSQATCVLRYLYPPVFDPAAFYVIDPNIHPSCEAVSRGVSRLCPCIDGGMANAYDAIALSAMFKKISTKAAEESKRSHIWR